MEPAYRELLVLAVCVTGLSSSNDGFYFFNSWFRRTGAEVCKVCYGDNDCLTLNQARCEFYTATTGVLSEDNGAHDPGQPELKSQVDSLMANLVERASTSAAFSECIPFISQYTDCTKENACLGCVTCSCDGQGRWNCSSAQHCRRDEPLPQDHRALVFALETLRGDGTPSFRLKRSLSTEAPDFSSKPHRISFQEVAEWMYEVEPSTVTWNVTTEAAPTVAATVPVFNSESMFNYGIVFENTNTEADYVAFEEVLNDIAVDNKSSNKNKNISNDGLDQHDYMNFEDMNVTYNEINDINATSFVTEDVFFDDTSVTTTEAVATTKALVDLLEIARKIAANSSENVADKKDTLEKTTTENYTIFDNFNDIDELNAVNVMKRAVKIMKRDVSQFSTLDNEIVSPATEITTTAANVIKELDGGVYQPLNKVIKDKQQELEDLIRIREKLIEILNVNQTNELAVAMNVSETADKTNNSHYYFYNVEIIPETEYDIKRSNVNELDKYLQKMKRDILVVMKDVAVIQRLSAGNSMPDGMKGLIRAMRHYIHKHNKSNPINRQGSVEEIFDLRRHLSTQYDKDFVKKCLVEILQLIDRDMPQMNALAPLSTKTRKIMRRILKNNKLEDVSILGLRVNDPNYNLTNDLKSIGVNWQAMTIKIADSLPWDRLHHMKMLQFILESDINKMNDALALIDFAHSRRMITLNEDVISNDELTRINLNLRSIHDRINNIIEYKNMNKKQEVNKIVHFIGVNENKKETFMKHIRNLLRNSKRDILNLLHKKVPKSDIIKELAKKKLNELTKKKMVEYENVMQKWQNNLDVNGRRKRSANGLDFIKSRIRNILPKYLRGKVNPKINSTRKTTKSKNKDSKHKKNKKSHSKRNKTNSQRKDASKATTIALPVTS